MAQIYPSEIPYDFQKDPKRLAERLLYQVFREDLDASIKVIIQEYGEMRN